MREPKILVTTHKSGPVMIARYINVFTTLLNWWCFSVLNHGALNWSLYDIVDTTRLSTGLNFFIPICLGSLLVSSVLFIDTSFFISQLNRMLGNLSGTPRLFIFKLFESELTSSKISEPVYSNTIISSTHKTTSKLSLLEVNFAFFSWRKPRSVERENRWSNQTRAEISEHLKDPF